MKYLQIFEWGLDHRNDVEELYELVKDVVPPKPGHFAECVQSIVPIETRLALIADSFPVETLRATPADPKLALLAARERAGKLFDGHFIEKLEKVAELAETFWGLWQKFKPV